MIRSYFGIDQNPFDAQNISLLPQQQDIFDTLRVHSQQGGLCLLLGEPGTGKSVIKEAVKNHDPKRLITPVVNRTLHTYFSTLRIFCQAFSIDFDGCDFRCEKRLIEEAFRLNHLGKMLVPIIDDAHFMDVSCLRKLPLLFEDYPKNHNHIHIAHPSIITNINLPVNDDIKSRITYSVIVPKLNPDDLSRFILHQLDMVKLGHNTFSEYALGLIIRSSEGVLRRARNLCLSSLLEAVRDHTKTVDLKQVNRVLIQPHWRQNHDLEQI